MLLKNYISYSVVVNNFFSEHKRTELKQKNNISPRSLILKKRKMASIACSNPNAALYTRNKFHGQQTFHVAPNAQYKWSKRSKNSSLVFEPKPDYLQMNRLAVSYGFTNNDEFRAFKNHNLIPLRARNKKLDWPTEYSDRFVKSTKTNGGRSVGKTVYKQPSFPIQKPGFERAKTAASSSSLTQSAEKLKDKIRNRHIQLFPKEQPIKVVDYRCVQDSKSNLLRGMAVNDKVQKNIFENSPKKRFWQMRKFERIEGTRASIR